MYPFHHHDVPLLPRSTQQLLCLTVSNTGVELSQFRRHLVVSDDFSKPVAGAELVSQPRYHGARVLDALPVGGKVPRVVLAAPRQPIFDVLIRQPVVDSEVGEPREVTIVIQCAWNRRRLQSGKVTSWVREARIDAFANEESTAMQEKTSGWASPGDLTYMRDCSPDYSLRIDKADLARLDIDKYESSGRLQVCIAAQSVTNGSLAAAKADSHFRRVSVLPMDVASLKRMYGPTIARCHSFAEQSDNMEEESVRSSESVASSGQKH